MIRNLKTLGIAVVAILAMSAMAASAASASQQGVFTAMDPLAYPVHVHGTDDVVVEPDSFEVLGSVVKCEVATFTGELKGRSTDLTITPTYEKCFKNGTEPSTVTHNGCNYTFTAGTYTSAADTHGTVDIVCPVGKAIEVHTYASHAAHTANTPNCTLTIGSVNNLTGVTYTNNAATTDVFVEGVISVPVQTHGNCSGGFTINTTGTYRAGVTVNGTNGKAIHVGV